ncbi:hypothetical protein PRNP1_014976 [Phytophthora ramorum]
MPAWGPSPFGPLQLSVEDASKLGQIARTFVQDHMRSYERYLFEDQRRLDERRWKPTKQRGGVQVFVEQPLKERRKVGAATQDELEREYRHHLLRSTDKVTAAAAAINSPGTQSNVTSTTSSSATTRPSVPLPGIPETPVPAPTALGSLEKCTSCQKRSIQRSPSGRLVNTFDKRDDRDRCKLCYKFVCSSCRVKHRLTFIRPQGELQKRHLRFCGRCVDHARAADTLTIASEELASEDLFAEFYQSLSPQSGETSGRGGGTMGM